MMPLYLIYSAEREEEQSLAVATKRLVFLPPYFTRFKRVCMEIDKKIYR